MTTAPTPPPGPGRRGPIVCLLPARDAAHLLPDWLTSVTGFADAVVALDDGSSDATREILAAHPLVVSLLENPHRATYVGWDDAANRSRLLEAAGRLDPPPAWIVYLDADERVDPDDGSALRTFLHREADPGVAYEFRPYRMVGDEHHYDPDHVLWVLRCFAHRPGQRLPAARLHAPTVPEDLVDGPRPRLTVRIRHLVGVDEAARRAQHAKYQEADPGRDYQDRYDHLLRGPATSAPWSPRSPALAPVAGTPRPVAGPLASPPTPALSIVVTADTATPSLDERIRSALDQTADEPVEVVVAAAARDADDVRDRHPRARVVVVPSGSSDAAARAAGLRAATGVAVVAPGGAVHPGFAAALIRAHRDGYAVVGARVLPAPGPAAARAAVVLEHLDVVVGATGGTRPDRRTVASWLRSVSDDNPGPDDARRRTAVAEHGFAITDAPDAVVTVGSDVRTWPGLWRTRFAAGRTHGRWIADRERANGWMTPATARRAATRSGPNPVRRTAGTVRRLPVASGTRRVGVVAATALGLVATWCGGAYGLARGRRRPAR